MKEYNLIWDKSAYRIRPKVESGMKNGWVCQGGIFYNTSDSYFYQAMIKK